MVSRLHEVLKAECRRGGTVALVIDEAQNIPAETLEGIRMLSALETSSETLIQIVLVGTPGWEALLDRPDLSRLQERITVRGKILPLTKKERLAYIKHRLAQAGRNDSSIVSEKALALIAKTSRGIPRSLNMLCENTLIAGSCYQESTISCQVAEEVVIALKEVLADSDKCRVSAFRRNRTAFVFVAALAIVASSLLYHSLGSEVGWKSASMTSPHFNAPDEKITGQRSAPGTGTLIGPAPAVYAAPFSKQEAHSPAGTGTTMAASSGLVTAERSPMVIEEKAELSETARLLAVLLDSGRVVVGRAQQTINNPRLEDKGFSSSIFESQLRKEFLARTGHDLRNLAPPPCRNVQSRSSSGLPFSCRKRTRRFNRKSIRRESGSKGLFLRPLLQKSRRSFPRTPV